MITDQDLPKIVYTIYNFSGLRAIYERLVPPKKNDPERRPPSTFLLWLIGIYVALFGIASQRYENRVDIIENRINSINAQLSTPLYKKALSRISEAQNMPCPSKPDIKEPTTVVLSLFKDTLYTEGVDLLKATVEGWKDSLSSVNLTYAILDSIDLSDSNLRGADLRFADLRKAILGSFFENPDWEDVYFVDEDLSDYSNSQKPDLLGADLRGVWLMEADLRDAYLSGAYLMDANFGWADLRDADLYYSLLIGADLSFSNLRNSNLSSSDLRYSYLRYANLEDANLEDADLRGAVLDSADFNGVNGLEKDQLTLSYYNDYLPINLPDSIELPKQITEEEWDKLVNEF